MLYQWQKRRQEELQGRFNRKANYIMYFIIVWAMCILLFTK